MTRIGYGPSPGWTIARRAKHHYVLQCYWRSVIVHCTLLKRSTSDMPYCAANENDVVTSSVLICHDAGSDESVHATMQYPASYSAPSSSALTSSLLHYEFNGSSSMQ